MSRIAPIFKPRNLPTPATTTFHSMSRCAQLQPINVPAIHTRRYHGDDRKRKVAKKEQSVEDFFIDALVTAASCSRHRDKSHLSSNSPARHRPITSRSRTSGPDGQYRFFTSNASKRPKALPEPEPPLRPEPSEPRDVEGSAEVKAPREKYRGLIDDYAKNEWLSGSERKAEQRQVGEAQKEHYPLASRLVLTAEQEDKSPERKWIGPETQEQYDNYAYLRTLLQKRPGDVSHHKLWEAYKKLPSPQPRYMSGNLLKRMFRHLAWREFRPGPEAMERYFELLNECVDEGVDPGNGSWSSAIAYAGRWVRNTTSDEVKAAIETWMRMEQAGHRANHFTFHILLEVAVRAERYALADTLYQELKARGIEHNRYFRNSAIYFAGVRRDGDGVRQAFRDLVDAGEIIDTVTMNMVIVSLLRAGEAPAAENTFRRMKTLHKEKEGSLRPVKDWRDRKRLGKLLTEAAENLRKEKEKHQSSFFGARFSTDDKKEEIQRATPIAPDQVTYQILIKYHAYTSGNMARVLELLDETQSEGHHVHGSVYVHILRGFVTHGGYASSAWNAWNLEEIWTEVLMASAPMAPLPQPATTTSDFDQTDMLGAMISDQTKDEIENDLNDSLFEQSEMERPVYFSRGMALAALHAFYKCKGPKRMLQVWDEILARWKDASDGDKERVQRIVDKMADGSRMYRV